MSRWEARPQSAGRPDTSLDAAVIIPTLGRLQSLRRVLRALAGQTVTDDRFEVIVVLNGPAAAAPGLVELQAGRAAIISAQPAGRARACNIGAQAARAALLVFLDDDMEPAPGWLAAHLVAQATGTARLVMGPVPVTPSATPSPAEHYIGQRFERHTHKLGRAGDGIAPSDVFTGNASLQRELFLALGGFDERLTEYGNEDRELARRLRRAGVGLDFAPEAVARQHYEKSLAQLLDDSRAKGRTAVAVSRHDPAARSDTKLARPRSARRRAATGLLLQLTRAVPWLAAGLTTAAALLARLSLPLSERTIDLLVDVWFWQGVHEASRHGRPRRVLHLLPSASFGGAEQVLLWLLEGLDKERWHSIVLHPHGADRLKDGVTRLGLRAFVAPGLENEWRQVPSLARAIRRLRPDIVHLHRPWPRLGYPALVAAALARPASLMITDHLGPARASWRGRLLRRISESAVDRWVAVSPSAAQALITVLGVPADRLRIVLNGIPVDRYAARRRSRRGTRDRLNRRVVVIAQLRPQKGHDVVLAAVPLLPHDVLVMLAGDGPLRAELETMIRRSSLERRVRMLGFVEDVPALLAAADVVVLPSRYEGLPLVVLEALAAGRPVVATDVPGTRDLLTDGETGLLVPPDDPAALARAIERVLSEPALAGRLVRAGRALVGDQHRLEHMVAGIEGVYLEICGEQR